MMKKMTNKVFVILANTLLGLMIDAMMDLLLKMMVLLEAEDLLLKMMVLLEAEDLLLKMMVLLEAEDLLLKMMVLL